MAFSKRDFGSGQSGQILLVVVLAMIVALTVGLSIAARIVTELKISRQNEESQRAFQAAESGIQQAITNSQLNYQFTISNFGNNSSVTAVKSTEEGPTVLVNNGIEVDQGVGSDVWLSSYSASSSGLFDDPMGLVGSTYNPVPITIYWGSIEQDSCLATSGDNTAPAIEVVLLREDNNGNPTIQRTVLEANGCMSRTTGSVESNDSPIPVPINVPRSGGPQFRYHASLTFNGSSLSRGLLMKVIPIYNSTIIGLQSSNYDFPPQGATIVATGTSGDTKRRVSYFQSFPQIPIEIFPYSHISQ